MSKRSSSIIGLALAMGLLISAVPWVATSQTASVYDIGAGVRALAMGGAFVGLADDEQAVFYNPAGLAYLDGISVNAHYERRLGSSNYFSALGSLRRFGGSLLFFSFGGVEERDAQDELVGTFDYTNVALAASGGLKLSELPLGLTRGLDDVAVGGRVKFLAASTLGGGGVGFGLDWGFLFRGERPGFLPVRELRAGVALENLPGVGDGPIRLKTGLSVRPLPDLALTLDLGLPFEFHLGGEFRFSSLPLPGPLSHIDLRAGALARGGVLSFAFGFGLALEPFRLDYAYISHPVLPGSHRLALVWHF